MKRFLGALCAVAAVLPAAAVSHFNGGRTVPVHRLAPLDADGDRVVATARYPKALSQERTCAQCHDVAEMRGGTHFRTGDTNDTQVLSNFEPWFLSDGRGGVKPLSVYDMGGLTAWEWTKTFGPYLPGGGLGSDPAAMAEQGGEKSRWFVTGALGMNCLACHQQNGEYDHSEWVKQVMRENWSGAAVAAAGIGRVEGMNARLDAAWDPFVEENKDDHLFRVPENIVYDLRRFDDKGRCTFSVGKPRNENCLACHAVSEAGAKSCDIEGDVHLKHGMKCVDCHRNGADHRIQTKACTECHTDAEGEGPKPRHVGIPLVHFKRLSCSVCHSGVTARGAVRQIRTARANRIGVYGKAQWATDVPYIEEPFFLKMENDFCSGQVRICRRARLSDKPDDHIYWTFVHDVKPARMARGSRPGLCADCHSVKSGFFKGWERPLYFSTFNLAFLGRPVFKIVLWTVFGFLLLMAVAAAAAGIRRLTARVAKGTSESMLLKISRRLVGLAFLASLLYLAASGFWGWATGGMTSWPLVFHMVAGGVLAGTVTLMALFWNTANMRGTVSPLIWAFWVVSAATVLFTAVMPMMTVFGMEGQNVLLWAHRIATAVFTLASIGLFVNVRRRPLKALTFGLLVLAFLPVRASWYWPFGADEEDKQPPRLHRLLEPANDYIEQAEDASLAGDAEKALELYKKAQDELSRVARENADRAATPEFAPLRNKAAATQAAIDSIRFAQARNTSASVAVSDTAELEAKLKAEREKTKKPGDKPEAGPSEDDAAEKAGEKKEPEKKKDADAKKEPEKKKDAGEKKEPEKKDADAKKEPEKKVDPKNAGALDYKGKIRLAIREIGEKDFTAADLLLEDLVKERPNDLNALILRAAAQTGLGSYYAARRTLEKAHRAHPKSHLPCYNLAYLMFRMPGDNEEDARQYYELGRTLGGPRDPKLEEKFQ